MAQQLEMEEEVKEKKEVEEKEEEGEKGVFRLKATEAWKEKP